MGLYLKQDNTRTELQKRIAAELAEKAKRTAKQEGERMDGVSDSAYLEGTKATTSLAWVWILLVIATVGVLVWLVVISI